MITIYKVTIDEETIYCMNWIEVRRELDFYGEALGVVGEDFSAHIELVEMTVAEFRALPEIER